jgi:hypothetical protein
VASSLPDKGGAGGTNNITLHFRSESRNRPYNSKQAVHLSPSLR